MVFNYKQWYQQNKARLSKIKTDKYYRLKTEVYQPYSLHCETPGCKECNIRELMMIPGYDTPEAITLRKIKAGIKRLNYLKEIGYSKKFGIIVVCKKCRKVMRHKVHIENQKAKDVKAQIKREEQQKLRLKRKEKAKKKLEFWLKDRIQSLESKIVIDQTKLNGYTKRLENLNLTDQIDKKSKPVKVKKGIRNWLKRKLVK